MLSLPSILCLLLYAKISWMSIEKINFYGGLKVLSYLTNKYLKEQRGFQNEGEWLFVQKMKELLHRLRRHFINLYSISCHCLLWTFIIIDSQLFSPSFRTYAFVYSCTDCCRSQLFFWKSFPSGSSFRPSVSDVLL